MRASKTIRRFSLTTVAATGALLVAASAAHAQSRASEAAVVRVEVVAAPRAPELRDADPAWVPGEAGGLEWKARVAIGSEAVLSLAGAERADGVRAALDVRREGDARVAEVALTVDRDAAAEGRPAMSPELPITLRIEH